jgi:hypothetical protein
LGSPKIADPSKFGLGYKGPMHAAEFGTTRRHKQHIAGA